MTAVRRRGAEQAEVEVRLVLRVVVVERGERVERAWCLGAEHLDEEVVEPRGVRVRHLRATGRDPHSGRGVALGETHPRVADGALDTQRPDRAVLLAARGVVGEGPAPERIGVERVDQDLDGRRDERLVDDAGSSGVRHRVSLARPSIPRATRARARTAPARSPRP